jgi:putative membrane fusion protein
MKSQVRKRLAVLFWLLLAAGCVAIYSYVYVSPEISGALTRTAVLNYAEKQVSVEAKAVIVRTESLIRATDTGTISYYISENEKARKYAKVADVYPAGGSAVPHTLASTGVVSYYVDGLEEVLNPDTIGDAIDPVRYLEGDPVVKNARRESVASGSIICKVITSDTWYIVMIMTPEQAETFEVDASVDIFFDEEPIRAAVSAIYDKGDYLLVACSTKRYYEPYARIRTANVSAASKTYKGLVVPLTALTEQDGQTGVMVLQINGDYVFTPVNILLKDENEALVSQDSFTVTAEDGSSETVKTVSIYDEVLRDAQ